MKTQARVVVIGGGVVGVSTLYHLTKKGWSDVVLVERKELTSGSTWHAAGLLPLFNVSYSVGQIHKYSVKLYQSLERETGQNVGSKKVSNLRHRQFRAQDRRYGRARCARAAGAAPVPLDRAASGDPGAAPQGSAGDGRAPRVRCLLLHARGKCGTAARPLRGGSARVLPRRA